MVLQTDIPTLIAGGIAACAAIYAAYLKGQTKTTPTVTKTATTSAPATNAAVRATTPITDPNPEMPTNTVWNPSMGSKGGKGPNAYTWDEMRKMVAFRVSAATKKNMLAAVEDPADREDILRFIAEAEKTNEYAYTIDYTHGYFIMHAVCTPFGINEYRYQVVVAESGMDKQ